MQQDLKNSLRKETSVKAVKTRKVFFLFQMSRSGRQQAVYKHTQWALEGQGGNQNQ